MTSPAREITMSVSLTLHDRDAFERTGLQRAGGSLPEPTLQFLEAESARLQEQIAVPRPWHYSELHNPWARAAAAYDCWGFLDLCQSGPIVDAVATLIGEDVVLFDSQWMPEGLHSLDSQAELESDAHRFPVDPASGVTVLIGFGNSQTDPASVDYQPLQLDCTVRQCAQASVDLNRKAVLFVDARVPYRVRSRSATTAPVVYAIRYFPASSRYDRDPTTSMHRYLTDRYPLVNYARLPLWLVRGQDHARNDFVTGFNVRAGYWTNANW